MKLSAMITDGNRHLGTRLGTNENDLDTYNGTYRTLPRMMILVHTLVHTEMLILVRR